MVCVLRFVGKFDTFNFTATIPREGSNNSTVWNCTVAQFHRFFSILETVDIFALLGLKALFKSRLWISSFVAEAGAEVERSEASLAGKVTGNLTF